MNETPRSPPSLLCRRTLHQQFVRLLLLPLVAAFLLASGGTALVSYKTQQEHQDNSRRQVLRIYERSLNKPLWDCDSDTARGIVDTLVHLPEVSGVRLQDICADQVITAGDATDTPDAGANRLQMPVVYQDPSGRPFLVGHLDVRFHAVSLANAALNSLWRYAALFVIVLGVIFVGAALVFRKIIGRPLARFLSAIHAQQRVDLPSGTAARRVSAQYEDELSEVVHAYNALMDTNAQQTHALAQAIEKLHHNEKHLVHAARRDPLTGLGNRLALEEAMDLAIARAQRSGHGCHVLLLDLNRFKPINDKHGHATGDEVLKTVAQRLRASVRSTDTVARLGGDEFVVVIEDATTQDSLAKFGNTIRNAIAQPIILDGKELCVYASLGSASFPQDALDSASLLAHADRAMYATKFADPNAAQ